MASQNKRPRPSNDNESSQFSFSLTKFLVIKSEEAKPITSLSPFIIEKQIESLIGTPKSVKNLKMNSYSLRHQKQVKLTLYSKLKSSST